jgi:hypothetical protein
LLVSLVEELTERLNRGEQPSIEEYLARYPEIAAGLQDAFDALLLIRAPQGSATGSRGTGRELGDIRGTLGDFRIQREIGRGGMGVVYEAEQVSLGRHVALKILPFVALVDPKQLQRFQNEARAAASLKHPSIVSVYSVGCERGVHYYAMEYIEGQTLAAVIDQLRENQTADGGQRSEVGGQKSEVGGQKSDSPRPRAGEGPGVRAFTSGSPTSASP